MKRPCRATPLAFFLFCPVFLNFSACPVRAEAPEPIKKVATIEGITEHRVGNGLRVLLYPDASSSRVTVNMTILVGSRHEGYGETGMAHLLEHMVFKGTPTHPDIPKALRDHGAQFNGTTWVDRTNYFETMPASDKNLEFALRLEADRLVNSLIRREDLASEMTVVRNEFERFENRNDGVLRQRISSTAYEWHNYGKETIGNRTDIERVPVDRLREFYRKYYRPDNVVLIVAGKFDEKKSLEWIAKYFGVLKKPAQPIEKTYTEEPAQDGEREVILRRVGKVGLVGAAFHVPAAGHPDYAACEVLTDLLDADPTGRLHKNLVLTKKASSVNATMSPWHDPGLFTVLAQADSGEEEAIRALRGQLIAELDKLGETPFTKEEVERVKRRRLRQRDQQMNSVNTVGITLSEWAACGDWRLFFLHRDRLEKVTPADVSRVISRYLQRSNRTVGLYIPSSTVQRTPVPETPDVAELVKDYKGGTAVSSGEQFDPTPENIEARVKRLGLPSPSTIKAAVLPKKTRNDAVYVTLTLRFGNEESLKGNTLAAQFLGPLMRRGTKDMTRQQFDDELDKLQGRLFLSSSAGQLTVSILCKRDSLPAVLKLTGKMLREPAFAMDDFELIKRQALRTLEQRKTDPQQLGTLALSRALGPTEREDIHYVPTLDESASQIEGTTLEAVKKLYRDQLGGRHGELVVVGEADPDAVTKQLADVLDGWKPGLAIRRVPDRAFPDRKPEKIVIDTPDKANAIYLAGMGLALKTDNEDYPALQIANYLLGGAPLASRLSRRVRGTEGLSYSIRSTLSAGALDPAGQFSIMAICNPANMGKVEKAIAEELEKFVKEGVEEKELAEAVKAFLESAKNARSTEFGLMGQLASGLVTGRTLAYQAQREKDIAALTVEKVNAAIRKHLDPKRLTHVRAGDFKKGMK